MTVDQPVADAGGPRWLTPPELRAWKNLARLMIELSTALDRQLRDDAGIPHAYYQILTILSERGDRAMRMTDLARITGTTPSRLSHAVASLEQRGWVKRRPCPTDGRGQIAHLTDAGMAGIEAAAPGHVDEVRHLVFDRLTAAEVDQLAAITVKLIGPLPSKI